MKKKNSKKKNTKRKTAKRAIKTKKILGKKSKKSIKKIPKKNKKPVKRKKISKKNLKTKKAFEKSSNLITPDMTFGEVIDKYPETALVMLKYGLHCVGCHIAAYETIEQGAKAHGLNDKALKQLIDEMNDVARNSER